MSRTLFAAAFIVCWWWAAHTWQTQPPRVSTTDAGELHAVYSSTKSDTEDLLQCLSPLDREELLAALSGDPALAAHLLTAWDLDAQILMESGIKGICRLPAESLLRACSLAYALQNSSSSPSKRRQLHRLHRASIVHDDRGELFTLRDNPTIFPQTYAAATFLLAISDIDAIVALPRGLRHQQRLFPHTSLSTIPLDSDRYHAELLQSNRPDIAIVADYSDPSFLAALTDQEIPLFTLKAPEDLAGISQALVRLGHLVDRAPEAQVLAAVYDGCLLALSNRTAVLTAAERMPKRPLFLFSYNNQWYLPTARTLTGELLKLLNLAPSSVNFPTSSSNGLTPLTLEQLVGYDPDHLIIVTHDPAHARELCSHSPICDLTACRQGHVYTVDADVQESIAQHVALAALDLYKTL